MAAHVALASMAQAREQLVSDPALLDQAEERACAVASGSQLPCWAPALAAIDAPDPVVEVTGNPLAYEVPSPLRLEHALVGEDVRAVGERLPLGCTRGSS